MKYIIRDKSYKFELAETVCPPSPFLTEDIDCSSKYVTVEKGITVIKKGYAWDGSSIPFKRFLGKITFGKYDPDRYCKEASLVHDAFYQLMRLNFLDRKYKDTIDRLYEKMCIEGAKKIILASQAVVEKKIMASGFSERKKGGKLIKLDKKTDRLIKKLPAWAARRYWAVKHFGARTLKPRYYPEKTILST